MSANVNVMGVLIKVQLKMEEIFLNRSGYCSGSPLVNRVKRKG